MNPSTQSVSQDHLTLTALVGREVADNPMIEGVDEFSKTFDLEIEYLEVAIDEPVVQIRTELAGDELGDELPQDGNLIPSEGLAGNELPQVGTLVPSESVIQEATKGAEAANAAILASPDVEPIAEDTDQNSVISIGVIPHVTEGSGRQEQVPADTAARLNVPGNPKLRALWQMQVLAKEEPPRGELPKEQATSEMTRPAMSQPAPVADPGLARLPTTLNNLEAMKSSTGIQIRVGEPGWGEAMVSRITLLVGQRISSAQIHINPPELGPIEVRVSLNQEQASVLFVSHSAQVREVLAQSIPRLSDMLAQMGVDLAEANVSDQTPSQHQPGSGESDRSAESVEEHASFDSENMPGTHTLLGIIDFYV